MSYCQKHPSATIAKLSEYSDEFINAQIQYLVSQKRSEIAEIMEYMSPIAQTRTVKLV